METVFDALKAMGKAMSAELAARLDISREASAERAVGTEKEMASLIVNYNPVSWLAKVNPGNREQPAQSEVPDALTRRSNEKLPLT